MDTTQLLLTIILSLTTLLLIFIGVQLIFVLREVRKTINKINTIVDGFGSISTGLNHGFTEISGFLKGVKTIMKVIDTVHPSKKH